MEPEETRTKQIALAQVIIEDLSLLQLGSTLEDINSGSDRQNSTSYGPPL